MCNDCQPDQIIQASCKPIDASCVIYNSDQETSDLTCFADIEPGTNLKVILEKLDQFLCEIKSVPVLSCVKEKLGIPIETQSLSSSDLLQSIQSFLCNLQDVRVKASQGDKSSGYLVDKIETGECIEKNIVDYNGDKKVKIEINWGCVASKIPTCFTMEANNCIIIDAEKPECTPKPTTPIISKIDLKLTGTNCNGRLLWFNSNDELIGTGTVFNGSSNTKYYAICSTECGESPKSNIIEIPNVVTYTKVRSAVFTRNNCGTNLCSVPCIGGSELFTKTYKSTISQENVNSMAENDPSFAIEGQTYVNTVGSCTCLDCNCTFPTYNSNIVVTNATCNLNVIRANGQILIVGISNADKFGYSIGSGNYSGLSYQNAFSLNGFNQGNIETTSTSIKLKSLSVETRIVFRLYNGSDGCFKDIIVKHTPPDCSAEAIVVDSVNVSCEVEQVECKNYTITVGNSTTSMWYTDCSTNSPIYEKLLANQTIQKCSKSAPIVGGAVVTENGACI